MTPDIAAITDGPLPIEERARLVSLVWTAQRDSAYENTGNASNAAVHSASAASLNLSQAIAAGILATGGLHAPVTQARRVIYSSSTPEYRDGCIVPGFGNSFHKSGIDPVWKPVAEYIQHNHASAWEPIQAWSDCLRAAGKAYHPNAAAITAAVAELLRVPVGAEPILVIMPRLLVWTGIFVGATKGKELMR